jgi:predicted HTH transcriptional regulator
MLDTTQKSGMKNDESGMKSGTIEEKSGMKSGTIEEKSGTKSGTIEEKSGTKSGTKIKTIDKILDLISKDSTISITQLSTTTNITRSTIQKHIDNLKDKGIIRREGADKGGKWVIIEQ